MKMRDMCCASDTLHSDHANDDTLARLQALAGSNAYGSNWHEPSWNLSVFVSSTFTDTISERNIIIQKIQKELQELGNKWDVHVTFVDMRWGIVDESTLDHNTWIECQRYTGI